jgi:5-methylcytosine-specific restriction endonuclease McrA
MSNQYGRKNCVQAVWEKASPIRGRDPDLHRKDPYGSIIYRHSYGKDTQQGWQVDHIKPQSKGGSDHLRNLQALQSSKNKSLGNSTNKKSRHN